MPTQDEDADDAEGKLLLFPHDTFPANAEDWPEVSPTRRGWWVRVSKVFARGRTRMMEVTYLDQSEQGLTDIFPVELIIQAMRQHAELEEQIQVWITAGQFGDARIAVGSGLPRMVQTYWEEQVRQQRIIPDEIHHLMAARNDRLRREAPIKWLQQGLNHVGVEGESWESHGHHRRGRDSLWTQPRACCTWTGNNQSLTY